MSGRWEGSDRKHEFPPDWSARRQERFEIDDWTCVDCGHYDPSGITLECDHIGDRHDHRIEQLRTRCGKRSPNNCHGKKSARQGGEAGARMRRPDPPHPGLIA
jgi:5-methylcytosine-specific restriction protein A